MGEGNVTPISSHPDYDGEKAGPVVLSGIVLYLTTEGVFGFQDMHEHGTSLKKASVTMIAALLGAAHDMNLADATAHSTIRLQANMVGEMRKAAQTGIVGVDGAPLSGPLP